MILSIFANLKIDKS